LLAEIDLSDPGNVRVLMLDETTELLLGGRDNVSVFTKEETDLIDRISRPSPTR
jgi:hypothetical protein